MSVHVGYHACRNGRSARLSRNWVLTCECACCRPEFLNRLDEIIVFRQLTKQEVKQIADIMLNEVFARAETKGIKIDVTERFKVGTSATQPSVTMNADAASQRSRSASMPTVPAPWSSSHNDILPVFRLRSACSLYRVWRAS